MQKLTWLLAAILTSSIAGCSSESASHNEGEIDSAAEELNAASLRAATAFRGVVAPASVVTVAYEGASAPYPRATPYLAIEIASASESADGVGTRSVRPLAGEILKTQQVSVIGPFPSAPRVLVVDENFKVLARTTATPQPDGRDVATVVAPRNAGKRFVLVRDPRWSRPMSFDVAVTAAER